MRELMHVKTSAGRVAVRVSSGGRAPVLLIHGNSMSGEAFNALLSGPLGRTYRLIAADLPGHGASADAVFPDKAYTIPGFADAMLDVLFALDAADATLCGWSLGGHIALEMMARSPFAQAAFTIAAPPVTPGPSAIGGFNVTGAIGLFMTEDLCAADKRRLAELSAGAPAPDFAYAAAARADGRMRRVVVESMLNGVGADPAPLFAETGRLVALAIGEHEAFVAREFMKSVNGPALWRGGVQEIAGGGHAPFLDAPGTFNEMLLAFLRDAARLKQTRPVGPIGTFDMNRRIA
ncbi:MAG: alpha/beta fold hydrolase [Beijerinckiaceae bacterium]